jgi:uncharacterized protein
MNDTSTMTRDAQRVAEIATPNASRYLQQLGKHFAHRLPVTFDPHAGAIAFAFGECRLEAGEDVLKLTVTTPDASQLEQLQDVVARHLVRFAFREDMRIDWRTI